MKLIQTTFALIAIAIASSASATVIRVTDVQNPYVHLGEGQQHTVYHDLTDNGVPDQFQATDAWLRLGFSDGFFHGDWALDVASITATGLSKQFEVDGTHVWGLDIRWVSLGADTLDDLNLDGILAVTVTAVKTKKGYNDFWWKTSKLVADLEAVEVPAPATLALLGLGLAGMGAAARRRRTI